MNKNLLNVDTDGLIKRNSSNTSYAQRNYYNRRKSSIPYAGRQPRVRFLRHVEPFSYTDFTDDTVVVSDDPTALDNINNIPLSYDVNEKPKRSILKKSKFPILVNFNLLQTRPISDLTGQKVQTTNDELEDCAEAVESLVQIFYKAERQARGAVDILTFPVAAGTVEPLSRFEGSIIVSILAVEKISSIEKDRQANPLLKLLELLKDLVASIQEAGRSARELRKASSSRYQEWSNLLKRKTDFRIDHKRIQTPLYFMKAMPESVTIYEDIIDENKRYKFDGSTRIFRTARDIILLTDVHNEEFMKYPEEIDQEQLQMIAESVIDHAKDLMIYAQKNIEMAIQTLLDPELDNGFQFVKDRIIHIEFDAFFDPLCALELKNSLKDIVERKGELLNISEHTERYLISVEKSTKKVQKYCAQISKEIITKVKTKEKCFGCIKPLTADSCLESLQTLGERDFMISLPLTDDFERTVFHLEPTPVESRKSQKLP